MCAMWSTRKAWLKNPNFCYSFSFSSSLFFKDKEKREKGKRITKAVILNHAFLLDRAMCITSLQNNALFFTKFQNLPTFVHQSPFNKGDGEEKRKDCTKVVRLWFTKSFIIMYFYHLSNFIIGGITNNLKLGLE